MVLFVVILLLEILPLLTIDQMAHGDRKGAAACPYQSCAGLVAGPGGYRGQRHGAWSDLGSVVIIGKRGLHPVVA